MELLFLKGSSLISVCFSVVSRREKSISTDGGVSPVAVEVGESSLFSPFHFLPSRWKANFSPNFLSRMQHERRGWQELQDERFPNLHHRLVARHHLRPLAGRFPSLQ